MTDRPLDSRSFPSALKRLSASLRGMFAQQEGPPDLDELWRELKRKLANLMPGGGSGGPRRNDTPPGDSSAASAGLFLILAVIGLAWMGSGFFIVQEGEQAVITSFGKPDKTVNAGFQWRWPFPFQQHETVKVSQVRSVDVGRNTVNQSTGLKDSSMLTQDENIVDIRFTVQYRLKDAKDFLFENFKPDDAVQLAAESAVREIVGRSTMDSVLYEQRDAIAVDLAKSVQAQLERLKAGIQIVSVNMGSVQAPEKVQDAFDDAFKANADREREKNEGEAYANNVIPTAKGQAARLMQEAEAYRARVVATAEGDAQRFRSVLAEYQKAPGVTRDRLYIDAMQQIYANVTKVMVDSRSGSNLLYLPLEKLLAGQTQLTTTLPTTIVEAPSGGAGAGSVDIRSREGLRTRERESR